MDIALNFAVVLLPLFYLLVAVSYGYLFFADNASARRLAPRLFHATLALHLGYLILLGVRWQQLPTATLSQALSAVAFAVAVVYALVEWRGREPSTGFWMLSFVALFEILSSLLRTPSPPDREIFHSPLFADHTAMGLLGYTAFVAAASYGVFSLRLYQEIRRGQFSLFVGK